VFALLALITCCHAAQAAAPGLRPEVEAFVQEMAAKHGHDVGELRALMAQAQTRESILRVMNRPGTAVTWAQYRKRIVDRVRIDGGVRFWRANAEALERARREFGVPEELIVATIGIETLYGRHTGNIRVLDALSTLAFDYPRRAAFFRGELEEYLLLVREAGLDPLGTEGSYAGAIGVPQFLPSSYRKYAVDFDGDGRPDLVNSVPDAVGSVANYYRTFGWQTGAPVIVNAESGNAELAPLIAGGIQPHVSIGELRKQGLAIAEKVSDDAQAAVFFVQEESGPRLVLGLNNFYVITRYNRSTNYAMAVHELAREIKAALHSR
jgi:membrane-bound lytic murein transglycosylase B